MYEPDDRSITMHERITTMFDLTDKVSLIIGGARDLGLDMARTLAAAGSHLAITSTSIARAKKTAESLKADYAVDVLALELDHTDPDAVARIANDAAKWKGHIDILINNAGGGSGAGKCRLLERSPKDIADLIDKNLIGTMYCCQAVGKIMAEQGHGKIINIASMAGLIGRDRRMYDRSDMQGQPIDYAAAKAGVIGMTRDLAAYLAPMGVYVNAISPGGFRRKLPESFVADYSDRTPLGRMGIDGVDLNGAALFLASAASDYVTGHNLVVDGGFSIWQ